MIEFIIIFTVLFFIAVLFYKQANENFEILQVEASRISELPTIYSERTPIVVSNFQPPNLGTESELLKRHTILSMYVTKGATLRQLLSSRTLKTFVFPKATAEFLAKETGLSVWFSNSLFTSLLPSPYSSWFYTHKTSLWPDHRGMFKTTAFQTILMPTQGNATVVLMLGSVVPYLPLRWETKAFHSLTADDTPLLNQIKYIEIKVRKGTLLSLPAHMIVDISGHDSVWTFIGEIHHPISLMA